MPDDDLDAVFEVAGVDPRHLGPGELGRLTGRDDTAEFMLVPSLMPGLAEDQQRSPGFLEIHDREWWIDASGPAGKDYLRTLLTADAIAEALGLFATLSWIAAVLPAVATVEAITFEDQRLHVAVRLKPSPTMPEHLAEDINPQDFGEFADALAAAAAGKAVTASSGVTVTFRSPAR
ncbi:hypothetical protein Ade02nite_59600 [Paractinoplanes deccanensis]|uniref:Uncharacterized protein n=1 Tax=Paractinoplanes deccanensis TaxID=113561 RepID=A0ABQ3YBB8_9ACTN|nr:hypothetical protein [Actinoplanes deccanensis]GID77319.1 hypothetical protein Ade02nite_59600 [Actinoplanes deccanensis]